MRRFTGTHRFWAAFLALCLSISGFVGCGINSQHLEMTYGENSNENIQSWDNAETSDTTTWENATVVYWSDIDEYSDWVYSELLFEEITDEMPVIECRVLDYQNSGLYFDGEKVYQMVGDKFDINSFISKYAVGTGVIVICVILNVVTKGAPRTIACFFAGAADASISMATKGAAFGAAMKAVITAIKTGGDLEETFYGALEGSSDGYMWGAIFGAVTGGFQSKYCFTEDTAVVTCDGLCSISCINIGDLVYTFDETTGTFCYKPVTQINVNKATATIRVQIGGDAIECTSSHPFLTEQGWISASQLKQGDRVLTESGYYMAVSSVEGIAYDSPIPIYTLCVADSHCYLVGDNGIVVHNRCKPNEKYANDTYKFPEGSAQAKKYPKGVPFDADGYPVYKDYAIKTVKFEYPSLEGKAAGKCLTGNCTTDFKMANQAAGLASTPHGYTWHHHQDMMTMELVPQDIHSVAFGGVAHAGGESALAEFWASLASSAIP